MTAPTARSVNTALICAAMKSAGTSWMPKTPLVFCAVSAVATAAPKTPSAENVFRSAAMPAPPLGSRPAIVTAMGALMRCSAAGAVDLAQSRRARAPAKNAAQPPPSGLASMSVSPREERSCRAHHGRFDCLSYPSTAERCCGRTPPGAICASPGIRDIASDSRISATLAPSRSTIYSPCKQKYACNCHRPATTRIPQRNLARI